MASRVRYHAGDAAHVADGVIKQHQVHHCCCPGRPGWAGNDLQVSNQRLAGRKHWAPLAHGSWCTQRSPFRAASPQQGSSRCPLPHPRWSHCTPPARPPACVAGASSPTPRCRRLGRAGKGYKRRGLQWYTGLMHCPCKPRPVQPQTTPRLLTVAAMAAGKVAEDEGLGVFGPVIVLQVCRHRQAE